MTKPTKKSKVGKGKGETQQNYYKNNRAGTNLGAKRDRGTPSEEHRRRIESNLQKKRNANAIFGQSQEYIRMKSKNVKGSIDAGYCQPTIAAFRHADAKGSVQTNVRAGILGKALCGIDSQLRFTEKKYSNQHNELRLFIEGAEVTKYVEGTVTWTYESTNGMNSLKFVLNNRDNAFIITDKNICSGPKITTGWRVDPRVVRGNKNTRYVPRRNASTVIDETAKYVIYNNKLRIVDPGGKNPEIDPDTGMWLFPLNPYSCVIDKHDSVRLFVRIPHVSGVKVRDKNNKVRYSDLWMAVFTGFVSDYTWDDDPVQGPKHVNITCYDYRGVLERMRVAVPAVGTTTDSSGSKNTKQDGPENDKNAAAPSSGSPAALPSVDGQFLNLAQRVGRLYKQTLGKKYVSSSGMQIPKHAQPHNPYRYMQYGPPAEFAEISNRYSPKGGPSSSAQSRRIGLGDTFLDVFRELAKYNLVLDGCQVTSTPGTLQVEVEPICARKSWEKTSKRLEMPAAQATACIGEILDASIGLYWLTGARYWLKLTGVYKDEVPEIELENDKSNVTSLNEMVKKASTEIGNRTDAAKRGLINQDSIYYKLEAYKKVLENNGTLFATQAVTLYKKAATEAIRFLKFQPKDLSNIGEAFEQVSILSAGAASGAEAVLRAEVLARFFTRKDNSTASAIRQFGREFVQRLESGQTKELVLKTRSLIANLLYTYDYLLKQSLVANPYISSATYPEYEKLIGTGLPGAPTVLRGGLTFREKVTELAQEAYQIMVSTTTSKSYIDRAQELVEPRAQQLIDLAELRKGQSERLENFITARADILKGKIQYYGVEQREQPFRGGKGVISRKLNVYPVSLPVVISRLVTTKKSIRDSKEKAWKDLPKHSRARLNNVFEAQRRAIEQSNAAPGTTAARQLARVYATYVNYEQKRAGIYSDLVASNYGMAHPLMGKTFETAVEFLCTTNTQIAKGTIESIGSYKKGVLDKWNRTVLFGVIGRPMTFNEVSIIGTNTTRDLNNPFCPFNAFYHLLRPADGTGAATIVQKHSSDTSAVSKKTPPTYETRKTLLDSICEALDYQFFCNGMGDLIFEMPNYNAMPHDFGRIFEGAYRITQDWIKSSVTEEGDVPTGWVITGQELDKLTEKATEGQVSKEVYRKKSILLPWLARRVGVKVEHINVKIPGVGAPTTARQMDQLMVYAGLYIQRQIARAHTFNVNYPFRPYVLPNRPLYLVPIQRIGLPTSVTHSMEPPSGACRSESTMAYTRWLFRDGTFRFMGGGTRQPVSYTSFFVGVPNYEIKEGTLHQYADNKVPRGAGSKNSPSTVARRIRASSAFADSVNTVFDNGTAEAQIGRSSVTSKKITDAVDFQKAGYHVEEDDPKAANKKKKATPDGKSSGDSFARFYSPWRYSAPTGSNRTHPWSGWGYLRYFTRHFQQDRIVKSSFRRDNRSSSRAGDYFHSGLDIICKTGIKCLAPVDITSAIAVFYAGPYGYDLRDTQYVYLAELEHYEKLSNVSILTSGGATKSGGLRSVFQIGPITVDTKGTKIKVSREQWNQFLAITSNGTKLQGLFVGRARKGGLIVTAYGRVSPPNWPDKNATIPAKLQFIHLNDLVYREGKAIGVDLRKGSPLLRRGDPIGVIGHSMARTPHLHLNLYISSNPKSEEAKSILESTKKANADFLRAQLIAASTGMKFEDAKAVDVRSQKVLNQPVRKKWQAKLRGRLGKKKNYTVTVGDFINYMKGRLRWSFATKRALLAGKYINVHPGFYFKPSELIDLTDPKAQKDARLRRHIDFSNTAGRFVSSSAYTPRKMVYDPDASTWCGSANQRKKSGDTTNKKKKAAKDNQKVLQKPQDKKKIKEKTDRNLAKSSDAAKEKEAAAKGNRDKINDQARRELRRVQRAQQRANRSHPAVTEGKPQSEG